MSTQNNDNKRNWKTFGYELSKRQYFAYWTKEQFIYHQAKRTLKAPRKELLYIDLYKNYSALTQELSSETYIKIKITADLQKGNTNGNSIACI